MSQENIKSGKFYRVFNGESWDRMHFVTDANSVLTNDGKTVEEKIGAIKGVTTSTDVTEEGYAADATTVKALSESLGGYKLTTKDGKIAYYKENEGVDSAVPFKSGDIYEVRYLGDARQINITSIVGAENIGKYTANDFISFATPTVTGSIYIHDRNYMTYVGTNNLVSLSKSYNPSNGILTLSGGTFNVTVSWDASHSGNNYSNVVTCPVQSYLIIKTQP